MGEDVINVDICAPTCSDLQGPQRAYAGQWMRGRTTTKTHEVNRKNKTTKVLFLNSVKYTILLGQKET